MRKLAVEGFENMTAAECLEVVDFISEFSSTRELSLRLLEPSYRKFIYARETGASWKDLVRTQLEQLGQDDGLKPNDDKAVEMAAMEQAIKAHPDSVAEQVEAWTQATGKSRATFFRMKKVFDEKQKPDLPPTDQSPPNPQNN
jgi:hypothetical protein